MFCSKIFKEPNKNINLTIFYKLEILCKITFCKRNNITILLINYVNFVQSTKKQNTFLNEIKIYFVYFSLYLTFFHFST